MRYKKICLCGVSGIGKTTLANKLSDITGYEFVTNSSKPLWSKYAISDHKDLIKKMIDEPEFGMKFQNELLDINLQNHIECYLSDRTPIDNMVYFMHQVMPFVNEADSVNYFRDCIYTFNSDYLDDKLLVYLPFTCDVPEIKKDGARITNRQYQKMIDRSFRYVIDSYVHPNIMKCDFVEIEEWDFDTRLNKILNLLNEQKI